MTIQQQEAVEQVAELEAAIKCYKAEYAAAIRDTETIRAEMDVVTKRVSRAQALLSSLEQERVRWTATSVSFDEQMSTLVGDNLLAAGFLTYAGTFDYKVRRSLLLDWTETLDSMGIPYRPELDFISYLCRPSDQVQWRGFGLPSDDLATQNAILLERFNRYPLVIDPSGQATSFILAKYAAQKMVQTSFLDASFMKTLASAIRFGTPLLVQDVESLDPVLNPVLNKELQKTGGRTLIRLGSEDIDFSPKFLIILLTRNPLAKFAPDLCSRVTMVNFTVTPSSLESQALSAVLKAERPDVDKRRTDVLRLQGEQSAKMRDLQDALLSQISAVQGAILDDDRVINTLETIKAEAAELNKEAAKTGEILEEVKSVSNTYTALASAMASVYFSLEGLSEVSFLYQYSLQFFLDIIESVLANATKISANVGNASTSEKVAKQRLKTLTVTFYNEVSRRVLRGLRHEDQLMFLVRLAQIATRGQAALGLEENEMDFLLKGAVPLVLESGSSTAQKFKDSLPGDVLSDSMARQLMALSFLPSFSGLLSSLTSSSEQWIALLHATEPEKLVPMVAITGHEKLSSERAALLRVLVVKALRPERLSETLEEYITTVFAQEGFDWRDHSALNLRQIVEADSRASTPLMLCSESGQDASGKVDALSSALGKTLLQVAMGSAEGFTEADKLIAQAAKTGSWVLLRNVHLCTDWLSLLEKKLHGFSAHANFRLFLTCNIHPRLPSALLRASEVVVFEASTGIKANIQRFYSSVPAARIERAPAERGRLYGLLAWFNAVVHERLRYTPLGWTKHYEFTEADTTCSIDVIDQWVDLVAGTRAHVDPVDLPWQALRVLLSQSLFGGRVDHQFDQAALDSFIESVFNAQNYAAGAVLARDHKGQALVTLPDALGRQAFEAWVKTLPDSNSPSWIGLPVTAESQLKSQAARRVLANLALLQGGQETDYAGALEQQGQQQQLELNNTAKLVNPWIAALPTEDQLPVVSPDSLSSAASLPAERWLAREIIRGSAVVKLVRDDLLSISAYCKGEIKATNNLRELLSSLRKSTVPARWRSQYAVRTTVTLGEWVADLVQRARALTTKYTAGLQNSAELMKCSFWVGGMFTPEAFVTATRQQTAQLNKWSLEDVELVLHFESDSSHSSCDARIEGAMLEGAQWSTASQSIELSEELHCPLPACYLRWSLKSQRTTELNSGTRRVAFPLYLTSQRATLVSEVLVAVPTALPASVWAQRGVAVIFQSSA
uniref:Dynein heavy chain n=1 Tax=Spumella elongata TaxID=89044 RepID=A0A7S3GTW8_9STRA